MQLKFGSLQLCTSIQIPKVLGGLYSEALYVDTNTNFTISRFKEILFSSLSKCQQLMEASILINEEDALRKLHYVNAIGLEKFCAFMHQLPNLINTRPNIKLIVIDSIAFPFKDGITLKQRTGLLYRLMADLNKLAVEKQIAIVITNEMTTRIGLSSGAIVGALGDAWSHRCNKRLLLSAPDPLANVRLAVLLKSNNSPETVGKFQITQEGIRDID
ncbi:DNA repair protein RAD51 homolog 3 isoform X2 [Bicyclus anynana]|uniref:DNA repair protein RAD51 homolog 3 n=1 Tax=Bicyclus anynana TaxID=110368 RepID=A0A6J1MXD7_BICAN|nr:DNA repair protein RAD51 homolog 3 isoform X2 [Bicyclus anynana]